MIVMNHWRKYMIIKYINQELKSGFYSKIYYITTIFLIVLFVFMLYLNYRAVIDTYNNYVRTVNYYKDNDLDIKKDLSDDYTIEKFSGGGTITNPILYYKDTLTRYIYSASPKYSVSQFLECSVIFFPLVFGILGLVIATYDYKYKTVKLKTVRISRCAFGVIKQLSIILCSLFVLVIALLISFIVGLIIYSNLSSSVPIMDFAKTVFSSSSSIITKFIFGYIIALIYSEIGYTLGVIFKNTIAGMVAIIIYIYIMPNLGSFDLKNSIYFIASKVFNFYGTITISEPYKTSFVNAVSVMAVISAISIIINMIITAKRSSFDC